MRYLELEFLDVREIFEEGELGVAQGGGSQIDGGKAAIDDLGASTHFANPSGNRWGRGIGGLGGSGARRLGESGAVETDLDAGQGSAEGFDAIGGDTAVADIDVGEISQRLQTGQTGVGHGRPVEVQDLQRGHAGQDVHEFVGDLRAQQIQAAKRFQVPEMLQATAGDARSGQIEFFESGQILEIFEALVGDQRVPQNEMFQVGEPGERSHAFVGEGIVAEIEIAQLRKGRQPGFGEAALGAAELLQAGPGRQLVDVFVIDFDIRVEMPAKGEALDGSQGGEGFKDTGFVFVARARVPDPAGKIELAQMREAREFTELDGAHDGGGKVDGDDVEVAGRQLGEVADGLVGAFQDQTAFPAHHPFRDFAFGGCLRGGCKKEEGRNDLAHLLLFYKQERPRLNKRPDRGRFWCCTG